ncbi:hypothetical protein F7725_019990 [Dissostichus mawsoni]|uniref:Uncharacterized protein n=1 Tax=Dissostichus mawsoni TaxID=36200 RepID=A0A7J5YMU8_DISMA|nr:hypothetical protein F7725_019990 [Dissostichus mawsoni]
MEIRGGGGRIRGGGGGCNILCVNSVFCYCPGFLRGPHDYSSGRYKKDQTPPSSSSSSSSFLPPTLRVLRQDATCSFRKTTFIPECLWGCRRSVKSAKSNA